MNEILTEQINILENGDQKVHRCGKNKNKKGVSYQIASVVQDILNNLGSILITLYLSSYSFCMLREDVSRSYLISALLFGVGICILIMAFCSAKFTVVGSNRLGYLVCLLMLFETRHCQGTGDIYAMGPELRTAEWNQRLNEVQGGVMITCGVQLILGFLDINLLIKFVKPISIAPTMILIGLFFIKTPVMKMVNSCWLLFALTIGVIFCLLCITYNCSTKKHKNIKIRNKLFVGVICIIIMWSLCGVLSLFDLIWIQSAARTDVYTGVYNYVSTLRFSFPFQWGVPEWKVESIFLVFPAAFITVFEILANFHHREHKSNTETNTLLSTSTLIKVEAILCLVMNSMGVVIGLNVDAKKGGRKSLDIFSALILIAMALSGFLCALFTTIPEPIVGALIFTMFLSAVFEGFDMLKLVNLKSSKNIYTLGISFFMAFFIPFSITEDLEITGKSVIDKVLRCLLSTNFIVIGVTSILLDNLFRVFFEDPKTQEKSNQVVCLNEPSEKNDSPDFCDCFTPFFA